MSDSASIEAPLLEKITQARDLKSLEAVKVEALGKKGLVTERFRKIGQLEGEARKVYGQEINLLRDRLARALDARRKELQEQALSQRLAGEQSDITLPIRPEQRGTIHPISQTMEEVGAIFGGMGFEVINGPEIEDDWHNFTALNMPSDHPARQMQDTFYLKGHEGDEGSIVLRTHTSNMQIRSMQAAPKIGPEDKLKALEHPLRIVSLGRTYRCDYDATHTPMYGQVEGLVVEENINMSHLKGCLEDFVRSYFGVETIKLRFRPSYFPFTEPSMEVDILCDRSGKEIKFGEGSDWLEILGCGMINPRVLKNCGINPELCQGFAFGVGLERLAMLKYGLPDLRHFFASDKRWLEHYGFEALDIPSLASGLAR